ncbi:MAG: DUF4139 domain-containing protein [Bacteroidetes bacterium]|nr:MAG: DUF4139 domain-containing protein [Bacteroidota bacterium]
MAKNSKILINVNFWAVRKPTFALGEISVKNNKPQNITITIEDQFPLSTQKSIEVEKLDYKDGVVEENTQKIRWKFTLPAKQEKKLGFKYSVKYPKNQIVYLD